VQPGIAAQARAAGGEGLDELARPLQAAQARLPGAAYGEVGGGNARGQQVLVRLGQGQAGLEARAAAGHDELLEAVAVQVHDAGQNQQAVGGQAPAREAAGRSQALDAAVGDGQVGLDQALAGNEDAATAKDQARGRGDWAAGVDVHAPVMPGLCGGTNAAVLLFCYCRINSNALHCPR